MPGVLARLGAVALMGVGASVASCATNREDAGEVVASTRQAVHESGSVIRGSTRKVCQLIGDTDFETGLPTRSQSFSDFGVGNTDLGYPVEQGNRTWFFFGDVSDADDVDPLGFTEGKPNPADPTECPKLRFSVPGGNAEAQALTVSCKTPELSGPLRRGGNGFNVPTGFAFDPVGNRLIGHFVFGLGNSDPKKVAPIFAEASLGQGASPKDFTCIPTVLSSLSAQFSMIAPVIADVNELGYDDFLPGEGSQVLLVWGTGIPYGGTAVRLAAVRLDELRNDDAWRFFKGDPKEPWVGAKRAAEAAELASKGIAREISVTFDPALREWRMVHGTSSPFLNETERGQLPAMVDHPVTILRTAPRPEGPWSDAKLLFIMKKDGQPSWADEGQGLFIHRGNQRAHRFDGELVRLPFDTLDPDPSPGPLTCASSFPSYCSNVRLVQDVFDPLVGCCTRADRCCDAAFVQQLGPAPSSWADGNLYGQYLIPSFTQSFFTTDPTSRFPDKQRVFWTASTLNPYVVVLMSSDLSLRDWDHDGVPNDEDNCELTWNPGQENCNEEAETALAERLSRSVRTLGDACDPVPCPKATMEVRRDKLAVIAGNCGSDPYRANVCIGRAIRNQIDHAPVGAGGEERLLARAVTAPKPPAIVKGVQTHARFCQSNINLGFDCNRAATKGDTELTFWRSADEEEQLPIHPWHRITLAHNQCRTVGGELTCFNLEPVAAPIGQPFPLDYGGDDSISLWQYTDDYRFWRTSDPQKISDPANAFKTKCEDVARYGPGTCLDGRIWLHADTDIGKDIDHQTTPDGTRVGFHDIELGNHYITVAPDGPFRWAYGGLRARELFFIDFTLPDPPPVWQQWRGASLPIIRDNGHLFAVFDDGHREEADFLASSSLRPKLFDPGYRWVQQAEASPYVGGRNAPELLALSTDGTRVLAAAVRDEERLREQAPAGCDPFGDSCPPTALRSSVGIARGPSPRSSFIPVYSREAGRLFVVGGRDAATGVQTDELWTYRLEDAQWDKLALRGLVGDVVAATFSSRDGCLWIIAQGPADASRRRTRLVRLEPTTGEIRVIASVTAPNAHGPAAKYDLRGLFLDMDGSVGIFASSDRAQKHRIALLTQRAGGYDVAITYRRDRALSAPPIVDGRGVALYYEPDHPPDDRSKDAADDPVPGDRTRAASRMRRLPLRPASLAELEDLLR